MTIQERIRKLLGIGDLLFELDDIRKGFDNVSTALVLLRKEDGALRQENRQLRDCISKKFDNVLPASPEFFDEMRKRIETRMDETMLACDRMADEMKRARLTKS